MKYYIQLIFCCFVISLIAQNLYAQNNLTLEGHLSYSPNYLSNLWGYVDSTHANEEYALVGVNTGLSIVDVTNPVAPTQKFFAPADTSAWREVKAYAHRAYVTNETGGGVQIVNLSNLPDSITSHFFTDNGRILRAHTLWIDENGYLYLFGTNVGNGGAQIYDLNPNPDTPVYMGQYDDYYIHDGFVRGDTLWASHIYAGNLEVVNVTDKAAPTFMAVFNSPGRCTHSSWPTRNDHYIFVTDEVYDSYLSSYNVQYLANPITPLDLIQADPGSNATVHNVYLHTNDEFATTSYYCQGVVIFDVTYPDNMIEVANYNTSTAFCNGLNGCWGEYPYLPSGNIIASDIQDGLYVLKPNYVHACWLLGGVTDSITTQPINDATVTIISTKDTTTSKVDGSYKTGAGDSGLYSVQFLAAGYYPKTINNVHLVNGIIDTLNAALVPLPYFTLTAAAYDSVTQNPINNKTQVLFSSNINSYTDSIAASNYYCNIPNFFPNLYQAFIGTWGYKLFDKDSNNIENGVFNYDAPLQQGYYDDFSLNLGWQISGTAISGQWVRGVPLGTIRDSVYVNPNVAAPTAHGGMCYMTGNTSGFYRTGCLYGGYTQLTSPVLNLSTYTNPYLSYYTWFFNLRDLLPASDSLVVIISSKNTTKTLQSIKLSNTDTCQWVFQNFRIKDFVPLSDSMYVSFFAQNNDSADNVFKAAIDVFQITDSVSASINTVLPYSGYFSVYPNPFEDNTTISYNTNLPGNYSIALSDMLGRTVYYSPLNNIKGAITISLKNLPAGIYICQLKNDATILNCVKVAKME